MTESWILVGARSREARRTIMRTAELLTHRLELAYRWYQSMVDPETGLLRYLYLPQADAFVRERCPIRDIASVCDVELLGEFLNRQMLRPLVEASLRHFQEFLLARGGSLILDPRRLGEPSNIARSAFLLLTLLHAPLPLSGGPIAGLAEGILRQQRPDGSYRVYFADLPDEGEELYAGEAMLALIEAHRPLQDARYLQSVERGVAYYDAQYFRRRRVADELLVFFANWQSRAGRLVCECSPSAWLKDEVTGYVFRLHDRIIGRGFYETVERHPERQVLVAVACALKGLNGAYALARRRGARRALPPVPLRGAGLPAEATVYRGGNRPGAGRVWPDPGGPDAADRHHRPRRQCLHQERGERRRMRASRLRSDAACRRTSTPTSR